MKDEHIDELNNLDEEYDKLSTIAKSEFHSGINTYTDSSGRVAISENDLSKIKDPSVSNLLKRMFKLIKEDKMKDEKKEIVGESEAVEKVSKESAPTDITKEIAKRETMSLQDTMVLGDTLYKSRYFADVASSNQAVAKILAGRELGIGAILALAKVYIVNGKVSIPSEIMGDLIKRSGKYNYKILQIDNSVCEIEFFEHNKSMGKSKFTMQDAQIAGLAGKDIYKKYPRNMLFGRSLSNGGRWFCPDAIHGAYTYEEMDLEIDSKGKEVSPQNQIGDIIIEGQLVDKSKEEKPVHNTTKSVVKTRDEIIEDLKTKFGKDKMKKVKEKLEIKEKLNEIDIKVFEKFIKELEVEDKEKEVKTIIKTRDEQIEELKEKYGKDIMKKVKSALKIEQKLNAIDDKAFDKFVKSLEKESEKK